MGVSQQASLCEFGVTTDEAVAPPKSVIENTVGITIAENTYKRYYAPLLRYIRELDDNDWVLEYELREQLGLTDEDVTDQTFRKHFTNLVEFDPSLELKVVARVYSASDFVTEAANTLSIDDVGGYPNLVQKRCNEIYQRQKNLYPEEFARYEIDQFLEHEVEELPDSKDELRSLLEDYFPEALVQYSELQTSVDQSGKHMGGRVHEEIARFMLDSSGLVDGRDFRAISHESDPGDILVQTISNANPFTIEVKSTKIRERASLSVEAAKSPSALLGFFDDVSEFIPSSVQSLSESCYVVYLPPDTLAQLSQEQPESYSLTREDGTLFFRANNEFRSDMRHYYETGELPNISIGHEDQYLQQV